VRAGIPLSLLVHGAMIVGGAIYLPQAAHQFSSGVVVPVELVTLSDVTNVRAAAPEPVEIEETPEPEADEVVDEEIVPDPVAAEAPPPEPERAVEIIDDGLPEETADEVVVAEADIPDPPAPVSRPETAREEPRREPSVDLDYLSGLVDQAREDQPRNRGSAEVGERRQGAGSGTEMTATLVDIMRSQAERCFRSSIDAPNPERLNVTVRVRLNRDGSLAEPPVSTDAGRIRSSGDPFWLVAEERALGAIIDCAPYRLPAEQYSQWRLMDVTFRNDIF